MQGAALARVGIQIELAGAAYGVEIKQPIGMEHTQMNEAGTGARGLLHHQKCSAVDCRVTKIASAGPERFARETVAATGGGLLDKARFYQGGHQTVHGGQRLAKT